MSTEQQQQEEQKARFEMAQVFIKTLRHMPCNDPRELKEKEKEIWKLLIPAEAHNVTAASLKQQSLENYIFDASVALRKARDTRIVKVPIRKVDRDLLPQLEENWKKNGFTYTLAGDDNNCLFVELTW